MHSMKAYKGKEV